MCKSIIEVCAESLDEWEKNNVKQFSKRSRCS